MLTVNDIKNVKFRRSNIGGYKHEDVDNFIDNVQEDYEKLQIENTDIKDKLKILADKVSEYRKYEDSIKETMVKAQKMADSSLEEAKRKSQELIKDAQIQADNILLEAKKKSSETISDLESEIKNQKEVLFNLKKSVKEFRAKVLSSYKEHLKLINNITYDDRSTVKLDEDNKNVKANNVDTKNIKEEPNKENKTLNFDRNTLNKQIEDIAQSIKNNRNLANSKFEDLKFGSNYNLDNKKIESQKGLFN